MSLWAVKLGTLLGPTVLAERGLGFLGGWVYSLIG